MLEHFCYIWLGQGGERAPVKFDDEAPFDTVAIDTLATIWVRAIYWRTGQCLKRHDSPVKAPA